MQKWRCKNACMHQMTYPLEENKQGWPQIPGKVFRGNFTLYCCDDKGNCIYYASNCIPMSVSVSGSNYTHMTKKTLFIINTAIIKTCNIHATIGHQSHARIQFQHVMPLQVCPLVMLTVTALC